MDLRITRAFGCLSCARGRYTLNNGPLNTLLNFQSKELLRGNIDFTCLDSSYKTELYCIYQNEGLFLLI